MKEKAAANHLIHKRLDIGHVKEPEEVESIVEAVGYVDKARKFTVYHLLHYWVAAASEAGSGYRFWRGSCCL
ncbi:hypothetical protein ACFOQM_14145 [Paenibacillus sp. GCM10012307]|uniref:hypothetical protein n=1 Tax=Paenibacillus TaxID=44249 RepID=UPI001E55043D|nr:hypothetical protein [Paenibacillus roseus]